MEEKKERKKKKIWNCWKVRKSIKVNLSSWKNIKTYLFICLPSGIKILLFSDLFDNLCSWLALETTIQREKLPPNWHCLVFCKTKINGCFLFVFWFYFYFFSLFLIIYYIYYKNLRPMYPNFGNIYSFCPCVADFGFYFPWLISEREICVMGKWFTWYFFVKWKNNVMLHAEQ